MKQRFRVCLFSCKSFLISEDTVLGEKISGRDWRANSETKVKHFFEKVTY
jgi:hypothetical protein